MGCGQRVVAVAILKAAYALKDAIRRMEVLEHRPTGRKSVVVCLDGIEKSAMVVRGAARLVVVEVPCGASVAKATKPNRA